MTTLHREIHVETEISRQLAANGWLYDQGDAAKFDRARALFLEDALVLVLRCFAHPEGAIPDSAQGSAVGIASHRK